MNMDFTMLGKTVPEPTNERVEQYVCSAGYSPEHGLVRMYPLGLQGTPPRWTVSNVPVERHPGNKDSRPETWRPAGAFGRTGTLPEADRREVLEKFLVSGVSEANARRLSLAVVRPVRPRFYFRDSELEGEPTYRLTDRRGNALKTRERFPYLPRISYTTESGHRLDEQYREWGMWELLRKSQDRLASMPSEGERVNYAVAPLKWGDNTLFLIGNYANHRTAWMVIASFNV